MKNIVANPLVFITTVAGNVMSYIGSFIKFHAHGYAGLPRLPSMLTQLALLLAVPGIVYVLRRRATVTERMFWALAVMAILASAAIIMRDDGWRALHVTHALTVLLVCFGLVTPAIVTVTPRPMAITHAAGALVLAVAVLLAAPLALRWAGPAPLQSAEAAPPSATTIVGGARITGVVIVPDGSPRPADLPTVTLGDFARLLAAVMKDDFDVPGLLTVVRERAPVALVMAQPLQGKSPLYLLAPPSLLARRDVGLWRLTEEKAAIVGRFATVRDVRAADPVVRSP